MTFEQWMAIIGIVGGLLFGTIGGLLVSIFNARKAGQKGDTDIWLNLQTITENAVRDKAESERAKEELERKLMAEIIKLKQELAEQKSPIEVIVRLNTHPRPSIISAVANFINRTGA